MKTLNKINQSRITFVICIIGMIAIMLVCNLWTNLICDDFVYKFSFADGERITNFFQIPASIKAHHNIMNGRYIAHFLVQTMLLIPDVLARIINALVFVFQIYIIYRIALPEKHEYNCVLLVGIFSAVWVYICRFGQVNLWLTGSVNYLWSYTLGFLFLSFYIRRITDNSIIKNPVGRILFILLGFVVGGYSEHASPAFMAMTVLLLLLVKFKYDRKITWYEIAALAAAVCGYTILLLSPATYSNKVFSFNFHTLGTNFAEAVAQYGRNRQLLTVFVFAFLITMYLKTPSEKRYVAVVLLIGSLISNYILTFASYYPERCCSANIIMLICADAVLLCDLRVQPYRVLSYCVMISFIVSSFTTISLGVRSILSTHLQLNENEKILREAVENGEREATIHDVYVKTDYSPLSGLWYIDVGDPDFSLNQNMARYYGLDKIYALPAEHDSVE